MTKHTAELVKIACPYCGESIEINVDCSVENQSYIEDCQVCCRPMVVTVAVDVAGVPSVEVSAEDDT
ncbi:MAG TPA: CPXCG motif-containing cysteine-rich protein [Gammaproteobacteria bacterium]|nr:CPXCG motif-containing cysteine-rich protein [Gammaproteobacteria bacterium]